MPKSTGYDSIAFWILVNTIHKISSYCLEKRIYLIFLCTLHFSSFEPEVYQLWRSMYLCEMSLWDSMLLLVHCHHLLAGLDFFVVNIWQHIFQNNFSRYVSDWPVIDRDFHMFSNPVICGGLDLCSENVIPHDQHEYKL